MANFLPFIAGASQGMQDNAEFQLKKNQDQRQQQLQALEIQAYQQRMQDDQAKRAAQQGGDQLFMDYWSGRQQQPMQIQPPPQQPQPPQGQDQGQTPAPGQASVPMNQPGAQPPQGGPPQGAQGAPGGMPPQGQPQGAPSPEMLIKGLKERAQKLQTIQDPNEKQSFIRAVFGNIASLKDPKARDELSKIWSDVAQRSMQPQQQQGQQPPQGQPPPIPPYQSMSGQGQQRPQGQMQIPDRPKLSMEDMAQWASKQGITNPAEFAAFLDRAQGFMSSEAKMEASYWKQQYQATQLNQGQQKIEQNAPKVEAQTEKLRAETIEVPKRTQALFMNAQTNAKKADAIAGNSVGSVDEGATEAATWNYLIKGTNPPAKGGMYQATMKNVAKVAKDNGMTVQELTSASADVKTKLAAKRNFEIRTQNLSRAENQLGKEIPVMEDAMSKLDLPSLPMAARGKVWALREMGDPSVTKLDQAANAVFNEFEGIITGNPGTLNVQDVTNAKEAYKQAQTPETMKAAIEGMRRIIANAKSANDDTRNEIMGGINDSLSKKSGHEPMTADRWAKMKSGDTFVDDQGNTRKKP